jgi:hypothetical protein
MLPGPGGRSIVKRVLLLATCVAGVFVLAFSSLGRAAATESSPAAPFTISDIFTPENRSEIYSDCPNARDAAEFLAKHAEAISADEAVGAQQFFLNCASETRASYNTSTTRYLLLALAAATYLEAKASTGARHTDALKRGLVVLDRVLPRAPSSALRYAPAPVSTLSPNIGSGRSSMSNSSGADRITSGPGIQHLTMNGGRPAWRFSPLADGLRDSYDAMQTADAPVAAAH